MRSEGGCGGGCCGDVCITAAERLDCNMPNSQACLDTVCPSKQVSFVIALTFCVNSYCSLV